MRVIAFLFVLLALASPARAASLPALNAVEHQLQFLTQRASYDVGIAALDLRTGEFIGVNADEPFPMASTVKIAIAANYLAQVEHGRRSLSDVVGGHRASSLIEAMIVRSDNHATDVLLRDLGGPRTIQQWMTQHNISGLKIDRSIAQLLRARRDLHDVRDSSTPRAMIELLRLLDNGELLSAGSRSYLLELMSRCKTGRNRMRGLLPVTARVENKTGTLRGLTADVGYITLANGRRVAVAFFVRGGGNRPAAIAWAARMIHDGFANAASGLRSSFAGSGNFQ